MPDILDELDQRIAELKQMRDGVSAKPIYDADADLSAARAHWEQGGYAAIAMTNHLALGSEAQKYLQEQIFHAAERVRKGDLSDIEAALTRQFFMLDAMATHYGKAAGTCHDDSKVMAPQLVDMSIRCSKASRQIASAIANIKQPKKTTFIKHQTQNILVAKLDALEEKLNRLEAASNAQVGFGSKGSPAATDIEVEAVGEIDGPKD